MVAVEIFICKKNAEGKVGNRTQNFMIISQELPSLDHEDDQIDITENSKWISEWIICVSYCYVMEPVSSIWWSIEIRPRHFYLATRALKKQVKDALPSVCWRRQLISSILARFGSKICCFILQLHVRKQFFIEVLN